MKFLLKFNFSLFPVFHSLAKTAYFSISSCLQSHSSITKSLDYEAELAVVIGKEGRDIRAEDALSHVFG